MTSGKKVVTALFFLFGSTSVAAADFKTSIAKLVQAVVENKDDGVSLNPKKWPTKLESRLIDVNKLVHGDFPEGIAYGAVETKLVGIPFDQVKSFLLKDNGYRLVTNVKTNRNFVKQASSDDEARFRLEIKVPVLSNFRTEVVSRVREDGEGRCVLEWSQAGEYGDLVYNQGAVVTSPEGNKTRVLVIGIHIIKTDRKVPWFARGTAKSFAKTHYGNFIEALESVLVAEKKREG